MDEQFPAQKSNEGRNRNKKEIIISKATKSNQCRTTRAHTGHGKPTPRKHPVVRGIRPEKNKKLLNIS